MADRWVRLICQIKRASSPQPSPPSDGGEGENQSLMQPCARQDFLAWVNSSSRSTAGREILYVISSLAEWTRVRLRGRLGEAALPLGGHLGEAALPFWLLQNRAQEAAGVAGRAFGDAFRGSLRYDLTTLIASLRTEINDPVSGFDDIEVVFDDQERVA